MPKRKKGTTRFRRKTQKGKGAMDVIKKIHSFVKDNKLISRGLRLTPFSGAAIAADMLGYGRGRGFKVGRNPLVMTLNGGRRKKGTTRVRRRRTVPTLLGITSLPKRSRRSKRSNLVKMHGLRSVRAPSGSTLLRRAAGQMGGGIFSDIGGGLGSLAHGIFG